MKRCNLKRPWHRKYGFDWRFTTRELFNHQTREGGANGCLLTDPEARLQMEKNDNLDPALKPLQAIKEVWTGQAWNTDMIQFAVSFVVIGQLNCLGMTTAKRQRLADNYEWGREDETNCDVAWTDNLPGRGKTSAIFLCVVLRLGRK